MSGKTETANRFRDTFGLSLVANLTLLLFVLYAIGCFDHVFFVAGQWLRDMFLIKAI